MKKFMKSKLFVILTPIVVFVIGAVAGVLLGIQPAFSGATGGYSSYTEAQFNIETAVGCWLFALIIAVTVALLCLLVRKQYTDEKSDQ